MDNAKIGKLEIEIEASSTKAVQHIKALSDSFNKLKKTLSEGTAEKSITDLSNALKSLKEVSSIKIGKRLTDSISALSGAMKAVKSEDISRLGQIGRSLQTFNNVGQINLKPSFANNLVLLAAAINEIKDDSYNKLSGIADALSKFNNIGKIRISPDLGNNLRDIALSVGTVSDDAIERLDKLTISLQRLANVDIRGAVSAMRSKSKSEETEPKDSGQEQVSGGDVAQKSKESRKTLDDIFKSIMQANSLWKTFASVGTLALNTISEKSKSAASTISDSLKNAFGKFTQTGVIKDFSYAFRGIGKEVVNDLQSIANAFRGIGKEAVKRLQPIANAFRGIGKEAVKRLQPIANATKYIGATIAQPIIAGFQKVAPAITKVTPTITKVMSDITTVLKSAGSAINGITTSAVKAGRVLGSKLFNDTKKAATGVMQFSKNLALIPFKAVKRNIFDLPFNTAKRHISGLTGAIDKLKSSIVSVLLYNTIYRVMQMSSQAVKEGVNNLSAYSRIVGTDLHKSMDSIATDALYIKNSFATVAAPIINAVKPAIDAIADSIANALNLLAQFVAMLTGANTYTRAIKKTTEYGDAVQNAGAKAKEASKTLLKIDELNLLNDNKSGGGGGANMDDFSSMFEEAAVTMKNPFEDIFNVFKNAWNAEGLPTINAIKSAWQSIKDLAVSVGESFRKVFTNGTGQETLELYLRIVQNIAGIVGGLSDSFRRAWEENERGTAIVQNLWNIHNDILKMWERITAATKEWAKNLDFAPILDSVKNLTGSFEPLVSIITDGLAWAWENVMLPIGKWTIEEALPATLNLLSSAFDVLAAVIEKLKPYGEWLWEKFLQPLGKWVGDTIIVTLEGLTKTLDLLKAAIEGDSNAVTEAKQKFQDWWNNLSVGQTFIVTFIGTIATLVSGIAAFKAIVVAASAVVSVFSGVLAFLAANPIVLVIGAIALLVTGIVTLIKHWDELMAKVTEVWDSIKKKVGSVVDYIKKKWREISGLFNLTPANFSPANFSVPKNSIKRVNSFANGGYPEDGVFFANHGELVGQFSNGRTAVVNNKQITEGIADAVYNAFMEAFATTGGNTNRDDRSVNIYLDGKQIATTTMRYQRQYARATGG